MNRLALTLSVLCVTMACSSDPESKGTQDTTPGDATADVADVSGLDVGTDGIPDDTNPGDGQADAKEDATDTHGPYWIDPDDTTFQVGVGVVETPAPLGIPTAGYGQEPDPNRIHSPFTSSFVAAMHQHTPVYAKALYLRQGQQELLLIRLDKIGTTAPLLDEVTRKLTKRMGREWDGKILLASNHSHLGPGRLWEAWIGEFANGPFWPKYWDLYAESIATAAVQAFEDAEPAKMGYAKTECPECHNDRRCENPVLLNSTMWVLRFDTLEGALKAVLVNFPIHGTVLNYADSVLSGDAPAMIEQKLKEQFDHSVEVFLFQSWAGDVSPADPTIPEEQPLTQAIESKFNRLERIGYAASKRVLAVLDAIETKADITFGSHTQRLAFDATLMDYQPGEWPFPNGGMLCGTNQDSYCWGEPGDPPNMLGCMPLTPDAKMDQLTLSAAFIDDLFFVSMPGEPLTDWALEGLERVAQATGFQNVLALGYTNDHWGYLMKAYDYLLGGYEPTVVAWGPQQGEYMLDLIEAVAQKLAKPDSAFPYEQRPMLNRPKMLGDLHDPLTSSEAPAITTQPEASPATDAAAVVKWYGGDSWFGRPVVQLQKKEGEAFVDVVRKNGTLFANDSYLMGTRLELIPSWNEDSVSTTRQFLYTVSLPIRRNVPTPDQLLPGTYRFRIQGHTKSGAGESDYELFSEAFEVP